VRVAVITTSYPESDGDPSGHFVRAEAHALQADQHEVHVLVARGSAFGWPGVSARLREHPMRILSVVRWAFGAMARVRSGDFDHAIAHWAVPCAYPIAQIALPSKATLEVVSHGADVRLLLALPQGVREHIVKQLVERACRWRFVSSSLMESLCESLPAAAASELRRMACAEASPIEVPALAERVAAQGFARGEYAVAVGRLIEGKQVDLCIGWAAKYGVPIAVVGDGPDETRLRRVADATGAKVAWLGRLPRPEALSWIRDARTLVIASREEGLSTVVREAAHFGTGVVDLSKPPSGALHKRNRAPTGRMGARR
jgi:glycosyltransferase involved in cell wall biosynthesis